MERPEPIALDGRRVRLEPVGERHLAALEAAAEPSFFVFGSTTPYGAHGFAGWLEAAIAATASGERLVYAVIDRADDRAVGSTSFLDIAPEHRRIEIGSTWYARRLWGSHVNPETKLLLLAHAFDGLGADRVAFRISAANARSRRALLHLGAVEEGTLRHHMVLRDGSIRDTVYFSILRDEWPRVRMGLLARLADPQHDGERGDDGG